MNAARTRIGRVKFKAGGESVPLPARDLDDDTRMVRTLIWMLEQARAGKLMAYGLVVCLEVGEGDGAADRWIESGDCADHAGSEAHTS